MTNRKHFSLTILTLTAVFILTSFKKVIEGPVVCFGDSITFGANVNGHSWVWYLSKDHTGINFINAGRSGRKTADKEELLPVIKKNAAAKYFLIFLGVNDLKDGNDSMVNNCITNMKWMIGEIRKASPGTKIVILSPCDINVKTMSAINVQKKYNQNTHRSLNYLRKRYMQLAREENTGFISLLHSVSKSNYVDGLHPNEQGQMQIAKTVWKHLNKLR
jgi:lysophospholipase L1-like esterase